MPHAPSSHVLFMPNLNHLIHGINNLVSLITKTKLGLSQGQTASLFHPNEAHSLDEKVNQTGRIG
jgi:hypothetical protein